MGKAEENRLLRKPRRMQEDNIQMYLRGIGWVIWPGFIWLRNGTSKYLL
jgi:hypothetical protein